MCIRDRFSTESIKAIHRQILIQFVLFLDDVAFVDGPIWTVASNVHALTALIAVLMTMVVLVPLVSKSTVSKVRVVSKESFLLISLYVISSILVYFAGQSDH